MATHYCVKVGLEIVGVPLPSYIVAIVKRAEGKDHCDRKIKYNPFGLSIQKPTSDSEANSSHSTSTPSALSAPVWAGCEVTH